MRIKEIEVKGLFNAFSYVIPMNLADRLCIIHGLNGYGKTTVLKLIYNLFTRNFAFLLTLPFKEFIVIFDDDQKLKITRKLKDLENENDGIFHRAKELIFEYSLAEEPFNYRAPKEQSEINGPLELLEDLIPGLRRVARLQWQYIPTGEMLKVEEVIDRFSHLLPEVFQAHRKKVVEWLQTILQKINVRFIETQRLYYQQPSNSKKYYEQANQILLPSVSAFSDELSKTIKTKLNEYAALSQKLDSSFPSRFLTHRSTQSPSLDEITEKLAYVSKKRNRLIETGLLAKEENLPIDLKSVNEQKLVALLVYLTDVEEKLSVFDDISKRIEIFQDILNRKFGKHKKVTINKDDGLVFTSLDKNNVLHASFLSSGEQHEIVMLYELLFRVKENTFILIDEPEISLHVSWQQEFISDLQRISELSKFDALIATHSPQIIGDRWDLTVDLEG